MSDSESPTAPSGARSAELVAALSRLGPYEAVDLLSNEPDETVIQVLTNEHLGSVDEILWHFSDERRGRLLAVAPSALREQWTKNHAYPEDSVGRLMGPATAVLRPEQSVGEAIEKLRPMVKKALISYAWVVNDEARLIGVLVFRDLLFADQAQPVRAIMIAEPFSLRPGTAIADAMREVVTRHFPSYPVCDESGKLLGIVRGQQLFEQRAFELSAQPGAMVGVEKEERLATPWLRSFRFRHPWLQLNLLTAFVAAAVVGLFEHTLEKLVVLAVFLPVLAGQSGNTGCQALAVALRGITLGELSPGKAGAVAVKEFFLGLLNGTLVGLTAGLGMFAYAYRQGNPSAWLLGLVVMMAMMVSCAVSGISGAIVPVTLRRFGADPATASSIFLTTATDVVSMGTFLGLATWLIL